MADIIVTCGECGTERKSRPNREQQPKLPVGWKRLEAKIFCGDCWRQRYSLRALVIPVVEPLSGTWKQLEADLHTMWAETTEAANWMMTQLYARDVRRTPGIERMPPMKWLYLYPEVRLLFPNLPAKSITSLEQTIRRTYMAMRCNLIWTCATSLPTMRYPQPFPVHNQSWKFHFDEGNRPLVEGRIGEHRWELRLKGGPRYRRQLAGLRKMTVPGELMIGKWHDGTIGCKLVGWLARDEDTRNGAGTLRVRTGKDCLLAAFDERRNRLWLENCDHLPRWIAEYRRKRLRLAADWKAEQRPVPTFAVRRNTFVRKHRDRMKSAIQEAAAHLTNFSSRRGYAVLEYDDSLRWLKEFPYAELEKRIRTNTEERGFQLVKAASNISAVPEALEAQTTEHIE